MFKSLKLFNQILIIVTVLFLSAFVLVFYSTQNMVGEYNNKLKDNMLHEIQLTMMKVIKSNSDRLGALAVSHSCWDDLIIHIKAKDTPWILENATAYLLEDKNYQVDNLYMKDIQTGYVENYGVLPISIYEKIIEKTNLKKLGLGYDSYLVTYSNQLYVVTVSALTYSNGSHLSGAYLLGKRVDTEMLATLYEMYFNKATVEVTLKAHEDCSIELLNVDDLTAVLNDHATIKISRIQMVDSFTGSMNRLLVVNSSIFLLCAIGVLLFLYRVSTAVKKSIHSIETIAKKDYKQRIHLDLSKEYSDLGDCINNLAAKLEDRDQTIECKYVELITILIKTLEEVDVYTKGHSERVSHYSLELAKASHYHDIESIRISGLLHDVGKIAVSPEILNKTGKLTEQEFVEIQKHPETAYKILGISNEFEVTKENVKYHHEKFDGSGYPEKLIGSEIPLGARIISIADVFDALTSKRSYREPMSVEEAVSIIREGAGTHFDPDLVEVFLPIAQDMYHSWSALNTSPAVEELIASIGTEKDDQN